MATHPRIKKDSILSESDGQSPPEGYQMPDVFFPHDRHTEAIENTSCESCHLKKAKVDDTPLGNIVEQVIDRADCPVVSVNQYFV
jgi:hypothetical protein